MTKEKNGVIVNTPHDYKDPGSYKNEYPKLTIPDQVHSLPEMLKRYQNGLPISGNVNQEFWDEESRGINPRTLDLIDIQNLQHSNQMLFEAWKEHLKKNVKIEEAQIVEEKKAEQEEAKP